MTSYAAIIENFHGTQARHISLPYQYLNYCYAYDSSTYAFSAPMFISGERGRLRIVISQEILEYLIGNHSNVYQVAQLLQISTSTVRCRMQEYGITVRSTYSLIDDVQLDTLVRELQNQ